MKIFHYVHNYILITSNNNYMYEKIVETYKMILKAWDKKKGNIVKMKIMLTKFVQ